ncbi:hypothetical protein DV736_g791, partial [Chaetothyriales sp. CBS 134916]
MILLDRHTARHRQKDEDAGGTGLGVVDIGLETSSRNDNKILKLTMASVKSAIDTISADINVETLVIGPGHISGEKTSDRLRFMNYPPCQEILGHCRLKEFPKARDRTVLIPKMSSPWKEVVQKKCERRERLIKAHLGHVNGERDIAAAILDISDVNELVQKYASEKVLVQDATRAYIRRAVEVHRLTNCLTEILFDEALTQADALDSYFRQHGKLLGPLHGVPITLKDQFNVKGVDTTLGNPEFTPGGSTGGEAVLLALQGSMIGWGTDLGGSIRIPAHINGLWGFKPTSSRLPYQGVPVSTEGQEHVPSAIGPMARSLSSLTTIMKCVLDGKPWVLDPKVTPIPWRQEAFHAAQSQSLTIGILLDDGVVKVHPPIERVLKELDAKIKAAGHEVVNWDPSGHKECIEIMDLFYTADGGEDIRREVEAGGEHFIPHVEALINRGQPISVYEYWQLNKRKVAAQRAYNDKWNTIKAPRSGRLVDVILMPTMPHPAVPHRTCRWVGYTKVWNFLDYPALSFPAGMVDASKDAAVPIYEPRNEYDFWNWKLYDPKTMDGNPIGLQIVGRRFEEEKVLGVASVLEKLMKG